MVCFAATGTEHVLLLTNSTSCFIGLCLYLIFDSWLSEFFCIL